MSKIFEGHNIVVKQVSCMSVYGVKCHKCGNRIPNHGTTVLDTEG